MAKRKRSKRKAKFNVAALILAILVLALAATSIALFITMDVAAFYVGEKTNENAGITGLSAALGYTGRIEVGGLKLEAELLKLSILNLIPLGLIGIGALLALPKSKALSIIGALLLIGGAVMFIFVGQFVVFSDDLTSAIDTFKKIDSGLGDLFGKEATFIGYKTTMNAFIAAGASFIGGIVAFIKAAFTR